MPKFYVQSGNLQLVTTASEPRGAAIWAVHRALVRALPFLSDVPPPALATSTPAPLVLGESVSVSEQGFDGEGERRDDSLHFDTLAVVAEWNQLLLAIDRLERRLAPQE
jgi:hypothetical protein